MRKKGNLLVTVALAILTLVSSVALARSHISSADVFDFTGAQQAGASMLVRTPNGISFNLGTSGTGIFPGFAYTLWVVVFNEPEDCITPDTAGGFMCGEVDVFINPVPANVDVLFGAGNVTGSSGTIHLGGQRRRGDNSGSVYAVVGLPAPGLVDPMGAEIHLIPRSHGPEVPAEMPEQINGFFGGCVVFLGPPGPPDVAVEVGECADIQFSIHMR